MTLDLNSNIDNQRAGYRLKRLEVLNWGTFDKHIWNIHPDGHNALLTGDIGSGKSTLVDAITTLLVPYRKITYNKAAGAGSRERSLVSYIRGAYKNEKVVQSSKARDVYLRSGKEHFTVLLSVFHNEGYGQSATLAQVYWIQNADVERFFVLSEDEMSIKTDFSDFGSNINRLKKSLRQRKHTEIFNHFNEYSDRFRHIFGIRQPEALDLFYQTVSMKSVGNLTDFVRDQMLGQTDIQTKIDELVTRYGDLTEAYRAVQRAKEQLSILNPLMEDAAQLEKVNAGIAQLEAVLEEIPRYFAHRQVIALQQELKQLHLQWQQNEAELADHTRQLKQLRQDLSRFESLRSELGVNQQLEHIRLELDQRRQEKQERQHQADAYRENCTNLRNSFPSGDGPKMEMPLSAADFLEQRQWVEKT